MSLSKEKNFFVSVKNRINNENFKSFTRDDKNYLIAEENEEYIITIDTTERNDKIFALQLYIDGVYVENGIKTFRNSSKIFGLKKGGGMYESFVFSLPTVENHTGDEKNIGTICMIFYSCMELEGCRNNFSKKARKKKFIPVSIQENKKYIGGLITKIGNTYSHGVKYDKRRNTPMYFYKYDSIVDEFEIVYSKFEYFEIKGLVDNYLYSLMLQIRPM